MKRFLILLLAILTVLSFAGCAEQMVLKKSVRYPVTGQIHSLDIQIGAADFTIQYADAFYVESNLKYLSVSQENGVLKLLDKGKKGGVYDEPVLTLSLPEGTVFTDVRISTGAARLTAASLSAQTLQLQLGAGNVQIGTLNATFRASIQGGAGKITVGGGALQDLQLQMGVGELELTTSLTGSSELTFGVGNAAITLLGSREDYTMDMEKGLGSITVDGKDVIDFGSGSGENRIRIKGGVGSIQLDFAAPLPR